MVSMQIKLDELTLESLGSWPKPIKITALIIVFLLIVVLGYWLDVMGLSNELSIAKNQEQSLLDTIKIKNAQAANLDAYKHQLNQINNIFTELLRRLPTSSEVPGLLDDISKTGMANGLTFVLFKPSPEINKGFYAVLPIQISVIGTYHQLAKFISDVESLDRIVTLHDFTIRPVTTDDLASLGQKKIQPGQLLLTITARTYRYIENEKTTDMPAAAGIK